ncbi:MAG: ketoacyl-ACP synthase III [Chitinophagales bacterium]|nr:ketoacyl-ACP synthase III [Chitinophagales bacterium]
MPLFSVSNIQIKSVAACVPSQTEDNQSFELLNETERNLFIKTIGIRYRRIVESGITAADLCTKAANAILTNNNLNREDIQVLIFVSQTPDYLIPFTACIIQDKLGLSKNCMAFDINLGCSGYVYGLSIIGALLQNMPGAKGLLLVGDCSSTCISMQDKSVAPLFSDAGSATLLEYKEGEQMHFHLQTDGKEFDDIIISDGGMKHPFVSDSLLYKEIAIGQVRNNLHMKLDGMKIFNFALREVPGNVAQLLEYSALPKDQIDKAYFHQANLLMNERVRIKIGLPEEKVPYTLYDYGNTSSASIPLTLCAYPIQSQNVLLSGFGVGLSWGSALVNLNEADILPILTY